MFNLQVCAQPNYNSNVMVKLKPFQADTFKGSTKPYGYIAEGRKYRI